MDILISLATVAIFVIAVVVTYYRFRDNFSDLADATDSKRDSSSWTIAALIYAVVIVVLYSMFRHAHISWGWR
jgi:uncharacterized membrane protein YbhN (UPF0104 family)